MLVCIALAYSVSTLLISSSCDHVDAEASSPHQREDLAAQRSWNTCVFISSLLLVFLALEPKSVLLCSKVCFILVPFAWGQALFSVEILRVHPNVQDLGVSARLSES